jgi:GDP-4-dehydro-6-deoxy-D-mannose reductase
VCRGYNTFALEPSPPQPGAPTRVLVTGPDGFVGRHLRTELGEAFVPFEGDVLDSASLAHAVRETQPAAIVHLAALSSVGESWGGVTEVWRTNVLGTVNVVEAVRAEAPEARVLLVSSGDVYGRASRIPTPEEERVAPVSPYGASKAAAELVCRQAPELDVVVARAFPHIGPGQDERFAVGSWAAQLTRLRTEGGGVLRVGDLGVERDLTDVRDVCHAYRLLLDASVPAGTYNVASGRGTRLERVVELLVELAGAPVTVEQDPERLRRAETPVLVGDASKLRAATRWEPQIPLERSLADALEEAARTEVVES